MKWFSLIAPVRQAWWLGTHPSVVHDAEGAFQAMERDPACMLFRDIDRLRTSNTMLRAPIQKN